MWVSKIITNYNQTNSQRLIISIKFPLAIASSIINEHVFRLAFIDHRIWSLAGERRTIERCLQNYKRQATIEFIVIVIEFPQWVQFWMGSPMIKLFHNLHLPLLTFIERPIWILFTNDGKLIAFNIELKLQWWNIEFFP